MTRRAWFSLAAALLVGAAAGGVGVWLTTGSDGPDVHTIRGRITESGLPVVYGSMGGPVDCSYHPRGPGPGQVLVRNDKGILVGVGSVDQRVTSSGPVTTLPPPINNFGESQKLESCEWTFSVQVKASDFYTIKIGAWNALTISAAKLKALGWRLDYDFS